MADVTDADLALEDQGNKYERAMQSLQEHVPTAHMAAITEYVDALRMTIIMMKMGRGG